MAKDEQAGRNWAGALRGLMIEVAILGALLLAGWLMSVVISTLA